ncbi:MAG: protein kinase [Solirubrobacterales bacterium]|nr:protein kinase [Solirubrobacterales bacterium]
MGHDEPSNWRGRESGTGRADLLDEPVIASGRRLAERYRLERPLGHGGMAAVWLATDERLGRPVAIKVLSDALATDDEYLGRFRREAQVAARLQHPNLVGVYDFDAGLRPYLVMEYVGGGDLASRLDAGDAPDPERLARELLLALRHMHAAGVLHRDIKPQNVLIDADGRARLTDFGIAKPHDAASLTRTGEVIGTESYIAPELMAGDSASERSDLFALGVVLADAGYWSNAHIDAVRKQGIAPLVAPDAQTRAGPRRGRRGGPYDFMRRALATEAGSELYGRRQWMVEPVFGDVKENRGIRRFMRRGFAACASEWKLIAATHNLRKLYRQGRARCSPQPGRRGSLTREHGLPTSVA